MKNTNLSDTIIQVFFFPFYYIRYAYLISKNLNISFEKTPTKDEFIYHIIHTFIGLLTINFFIYFFRELDILDLNYNSIINNVYAIIMYIQGFTILVSFSLMLSAVLLFRNFKREYFYTIFLFSIKIFNIFFPPLYLTFIYITQFVVLSKSKIDIFNLSTFPLFLKLAVILFVLIWFIVVIILVINTKKLLLSYYNINNGIIKKVFFHNFFPFIPILIIGISGWLNGDVIFKLTPDIPFDKLVHKDNLCIEVVNYQLYKTNQFDEQEISFENYQKIIKDCQKKTIYK
jgi:hypothetical protein